MITTTFHYLVEIEKAHYKYVFYNITHEASASNEQHVKTHEEILPLLIAKEFEVSIDKIKPITKEQFEKRDMIH